MQEFTRQQLYDAIWSKYGAHLSESEKFVDPKTNQAPATNVYRGGLENQISTRQLQVDSINKDQSRLRENMKALKGSSEEKALLQRYTRQLDQQEDRLGALQNEIADLNTRKGKADEELTQTTQSICSR